MKFNRDQQIIITVESILPPDDDEAEFYPESETSDEMPISSTELQAAYDDILDELDEDEDWTEAELVGLAVGYAIEAEGVEPNWLEPSSSQFSAGGMWYTTEFQTSDFGTGLMDATTFTPRGFSRDEQRAIYDVIVGNIP